MADSFPKSTLVVLAAIVVNLAGCAAYSTEHQERLTAAQFANDVGSLSDGCVSLHDRIDYVSPSCEDSCGVACLDMIFAFEGAKLPRAGREALKRTVERNSSVTNGELKAALEAAGFHAIHLQGDLVWPHDAAGKQKYATWKNPLYHLDQGRPVILRILVAENRFHYVLLVGYDEVARKLIIINPGRGKRICPEQLLDIWRKAHSWFLAYKRPAPRTIARRTFAPPFTPYSLFRDREISGGRDDRKRGARSGKFLPRQSTY